MYLMITLTAAIKISSGVEVSRLFIHHTPYTLPALELASVKVSHTPSSTLLYVGVEQG